MIALGIYPPCQVFPHWFEADVVEKVDQVGGEPAGAEYDHHRDAESADVRERGGIGERISNMVNTMWTSFS